MKDAAGKKKGKRNKQLLIELFTGRKHHLCKSMESSVVLPSTNLIGEFTISRLVIRQMFLFPPLTSLSCPAKIVLLFPYPTTLLTCEGDRRFISRRLTDPETQREHQRNAVVKSLTQFRVHAFMHRMELQCGAKSSQSG